MVDRLTWMQHSCIRCCCEGLTNAEIGRRMGISENTVKTHLGKAYASLGLHNEGGARTKAAVLLISHDMRTHTARLLEGGEHSAR